MESIRKPDETPGGGVFVPVEHGHGDVFHLERVQAAEERGGGSTGTNEGGAASTVGEKPVEGS